MYLENGDKVWADSDGDVAVFHDYGSSLFIKVETASGRNVSVALDSTQRQELIDYLIASHTQLVTSNDQPTDTPD